MAIEWVGKRRLSKQQLYFTTNSLIVDSESIILMEIEEREVGKQENGKEREI